MSARSRTRRYDLTVVGMGSGGMVAAELAATLGLRVAVVERDRVGGDCLWTGCVPSKALLASAKAAHTLRHADRYGLDAVDPTIDTGKVWDRIRSVQAEIAATDDNPDRFRALGVDLIRGEARVTAPNHVTVDGHRRVESRYILLCTGSRPASLPIDGLAEAGFVTSESLFELERAPESVVLIGGGPIGIEMAQAFARLGRPTTVLERSDGILPRDEPSLTAVLATKLSEEGVDVRLGVDVERVTVEDATKVIHGTEAGSPRTWRAAELIVAAGRNPNLEGLGLDEVGVETGPKGVVVDDRLRSSVSTVYAAGDVAGRSLFTHSAAYEASRAVRDMFFPGKGTADATVPWCTFTDPELAHVGLTEAKAREEHGVDVEAHRMELVHSDRARAEGADEGTIIVITAKARIVGAHILSPSAGELIHELALALRQEMKLSDLAGMIHVYPTLATSVSQLAADLAFEKAARFSWLAKLGRLLP